MPRVCLPMGSLPRGVSASGMSAQGGVSAWGGVCVSGGCLPRERCVCLGGLSA